jgi:multidrug efflux pump subunit AcrA (membrane-fusion protein)
MNRIWVISDTHLEHPAIPKFRVKEGQKVQAGDTLAILEAPDVIAKMEQARAAEAAAQAQNEKAIKGARQEQIQAAYEMWQKAIAGVDIAEKSYKRVKNLFDQGVMPDIRRLQEEAVRITVQEDGDNREQVLFRGIIQSVHTFVENGVCQVMCPAAGFPWKQESRS